MAKKFTLFWPKLLAIGIFFLIYFVTRRPFESGNCRINRLNSYKKFSGIVSRKIKDSKSHTNEIIYLSNGQEYEWADDAYMYSELSGFFDLIEMGDSIEKSENSLILSVYRPDTSFMIDLSFPCEK